MNTDRLIHLLSIVANLAVVAGLLFLGVQVRDGRATARAQVADGVTEGFLQVNALAVSDPVVACVWSLGWLAPDRLTDAEAAMFSMYARMDFNQYMRVFELYRTGLMSEDAWRGAAASAAWKMSTPGGLLFFAENPLPTEFEQAVAPMGRGFAGQGFTLGRDLPESCPGQNVP